MMRPASNTPTNENEFRCQSCSQKWTAIIELIQRRWDNDEEYFSVMKRVQGGHKVEGQLKRRREEID